MLKVVRLLDEEARLDERRIMAKRLIRQGVLSLAAISDATGLSNSDIEEIQVELKEELGELLAHA